MITVELTGGLGNQLFQYAAAKALSIHHKTELILEISSFYKKDIPILEVPRDFQLYNFKGIYEKTIQHQYKEKKIEKLIPNHKRSVYKEPFYHYDNNFFKSKKNTFLKGVWQSEHYFNRNKKLIIDCLHLKDNLIEKVKEKASKIKTETSVSIHIRRADYLRKKIILDWHGVLEKEYYLNGIKQLSNIGIEKVYYFTDDIVWVEKELIPLMPGEIISKTTKTHYEDFYLMSQCQHNIIANSSFSWWAAYLNPNPNKIVIAPKNWFNKAPLNTKDLYPQEWIII